ncbi:hypothetical protein BX600DRAFT_99267 [Xylariales sp. PMI_506]|nr:hypothetical protein BX600DRAFT_99267 [Xylariales sp. PMI_506]
MTTRSRSSTLESCSSSSSSIMEPEFPSFARLPPEIRHHIYLMAIPSSGINFFNIHSFPNGHDGVNRSTSPSHLYLDLRRLSVSDDDATVARYDPSAWQVRNALRQTCREARVVCAIPEDEVVTLTMTIPKRGLFVRAGDGLLRSMTPLSLERPSRPPTEALVHRRIQVHADDVVCFSVENCSFNLPFEEATMFHVGRDDEDEDEVSLGWAYDPQFHHGPAPLGIRRDRFCLSLTYDDWATMRTLEEVAPALFEAATGAQDVGKPGGVKGLCSKQTDAAQLASNSSSSKSMYSQGFIMYDSDTTDKWATTLSFWDRWGDRYSCIPLIRDEGRWSPITLVKRTPEKETVRAKYMKSAILKSTKRPARA